MSATLVVTLVLYPIILADPIPDSFPFVSPLPGMDQVGSGWTRPSKLTRVVEVSTAPRSGLQVCQDNNECFLWADKQVPLLSFSRTKIDNRASEGIQPFYANQRNLSRKPGAKSRMACDCNNPFQSQYGVKVKPGSRTELYE
jgi:hypothetical protein